MKVTIPITILNANPVVTPLRLVEISGTLGVEYSDESIVQCVVMREGVKNPVVVNDGIFYASSNGCDTPAQLHVGGQLQENNVIVTSDHDNCSMVAEETMESGLLITVGSTVFHLPNPVEWNYDEGEYSVLLSVNDFVTLQ